MARGINVKLRQINFAAIVVEYRPVKEKGVDGYAFRREDCTACGRIGSDRPAERRVRALPTGAPPLPVVRRLSPPSRRRRRLAAPLLG